MFQSTPALTQGCILPCQSSPLEGYQISHVMIKVPTTSGVEPHKSQRQLPTFNSRIVTTDSRPLHDPKVPPPRIPKLQIYPAFLSILPYCLPRRAVDGRYYDIFLFGGQRPITLSKCFGHHLRSHPDWDSNQSTNLYL
jgi:hypothetical protein